MQLVLDAPVATPERQQRAGISLFRRQARHGIGPVPPHLARVEPHHLPLQTQRLGQPRPGAVANQRAAAPQAAHLQPAVASADPAVGRPVAAASAGCTKEPRTSCSNCGWFIFDCHQIVPLWPESPLHRPLREAGLDVRTRPSSAASARSAGSALASSRPGPPGSGARTTPSSWPTPRADGPLAQSVSGCRAAPCRRWRPPRGRPLPTTPCLPRRSPGPTARSKAAASEALEDAVQDRRARRALIVKPNAAPDQEPAWGSRPIQQSPASYRSPQHRRARQRQDRGQLMAPSGRLARIRHGLQVRHQRQQRQTADPPCNSSTGASAYPYLSENDKALCRQLQWQRCSMW